MSDRTKDDGDLRPVWFQTVHIEFHNPLTGESKLHSFIGRAMFTPEEYEQLKDVDAEKVIKDLAIDAPYNPYEDETNTEAQKVLLRKIREALNKEEGV